MTPDRTTHEKDALRPTLLAARGRVAAFRERDADDVALAAHVVALTDGLGMGPEDTVAAYEALRSEPPTRATIAALSARGIRVIVPITLPDNDLDWCDAADHARMPLGPQAITAAALVLTPGLAVDAAGTRLGRGGGSYDRALARRGAHARVLVVLHPDEVHDEALPCSPLDQPVDGVLTVDGVTWF